MLPDSFEYDLVQWPEQVGSIFCIFLWAFGTFIFGALKSFQETEDSEDEEPHEEAPEPPQTRMRTRSKTRLANKRSKKRTSKKASKIKRPKIEPATVEVVNETESTSEPSQDDADFNPEYFNSETKGRIKKTAWFCRFEDCPRGDGGRPFTKRKNRNVHEEWYFDLLCNLRKYKYQNRLKHIK